MLCLCCDLHPCTSLLDGFQVLQLLPGGQDRASAPNISGQQDQHEAAVHADRIWWRICTEGAGGCWEESEIRSWKRCCGDIFRCCRDIQGRRNYSSSSIPKQHRGRLDRWCICSISAKIRANHASLPCTCSEGEKNYRYFRSFYCRPKCKTTMLVIHEELTKIKL